MWKILIIIGLAEMDSMAISYVHLHTGITNRLQLYIYVDCDINIGSLWEINFAPMIDSYTNEGGYKYDGMTNNAP
jgi:hypothetical protein